jgi:transcriptional regulator with XRE-family HTH domain
MEAAPRVRVARDDVAPGPLRLARLTRGWRQEDLAARAGISRRYVSLIEAGYVPAPRVQEQLAGALGLPTDELFPLEDVDVAAAA